MFIFVVCFLALLVASFETTVWFQIMGNIPGPQVWLLIVIYVCLYRKPAEAILLIYLISSLIYFLGWIPWGLLVIDLMSLYGILYLIKGRIFWSGSGYYWMASVGGVAVFHILYLLSSMMLEKNSVRSLELLDRIIQFILTPMFSAPVYFTLKWIEKKTDQTPLPESSEGGL
jgi:hypothetical protein